MDYCYCPSVGVCEIYRYRLVLNALVNNNTHIGQHNREYFFTVMATNNAKLREIHRLDILADDSPPSVGVVQEGEAGFPDIDYISDEEIIISWSGFIDHESGIRIYRVSFNDHCLSAEPPSHMIGNLSSGIYETKETSLKVRPGNLGKYYTTVIAFNNAMEPSKPVCSDGITFDKSKPKVQNIKLEHIKAKEIIGCLRNETFLILENLTAVRLLRTEKCTHVCNMSKEMDLIAVLPVAYTISNDTDIADDLCGRLSKYDEEWTMYLPSDKISMTWDVRDVESQIREVQIGFASDPSDFTFPDIVSYESVNSHTRYSRIHSGLDRGSEFYIILKAVNKADLEVIAVVGPLIIDETPPLYTGSVAIHINGDFIYCIWDNTTFLEAEQKEGLSTILFRIGELKRHLYHLI